MAGKLSKAGGENLRDYARLLQLEKMAYQMTDSARPKSESRRVAKLAAKEALRVMHAEVEAYEAVNRG
jgi:hypothetical protein